MDSPIVAGVILAVLGVAIAALIYRGASRTAVKSHHLERDRETGAVLSYAG